MSKLLPLLFSVSLFFVGFEAIAQNYPISNSTVNTCSGTFYDTGGPGGTYGNNELIVMTFCSDTPGSEIVFNFTTFDTEAGWDFLTIYDGPNTLSPVIGTYSGTAGPGIVSSSSGCLTFEFDSDGSFTDPGWVATISCSVPSCVDGIQNQGEIGVDCGGPCPACTDFTINMGGTINACSGNFYDSGGNGGVYGANELTEITICPDTPGSMVILDFTMFDVEGGWDVMCIYDGTSTAATSLGCYDNNVPLIGTVQATNVDGCLTIWFDSDGSGQLAGWAATISCSQPCQTVVANANFNPAPNVGDGVIYLCQGDVLDMNGFGTYPQSGTGYVQSDGTSTFEWSTQDGPNLTGQNVTHTFNTPGAYLLELEITDVMGCDNANDIDQYVYVSTTPIFAGTVANPDVICLGDQTTLTGVATPQQYDKICTAPNFPPLSLPDGSGVSYSTSVNLDCYGAGQTLDDINDLIDICVNMEHSYMGDLDIVIECPSGQQVTLVDYPNGGGSTFLGVPVDNDATPLIQGTGFDYCWSPTAVNGDWSANAGGFGTTLPAGTYESTNPLTGLVGCDMNGDWTIIITDNLGSDNGFIFNWSINFDPSILPPLVSFTPTIVSEQWLPTGDYVSGTNPIVVEPTNPGFPCYTYEVTDNFGCTYDTTICITVNTSPVINQIADYTGCDTYVLPTIQGSGLTGNQAYYTGPGGTGTQYNTGDVINVASLTLYVYDSMTVAPFCADEISFTITLDVTDPVITCPGNLTAVCSITEQPPYANLAAFTGAGGTATDETSLNAASFTLLSEVSDGNSCPEVVTRTYRIADDCGHTSTCTQTITIDDNINPTATAPANITVQCSADVPAGNALDITDEADNCGVPTVTYDGDVSDNNTCPETITRTWTITDACGNSIQVQQTITVDDTTPPTASNPAGITVECVGDVPAPDVLVVTDEADNCDPTPTVTFVSDGPVVGGNCGGTVTRTYRITDDCGNTTDVTQTITIDDTTPPTATAPADITVQCPADVPAGHFTQITDEADNCTAVPTVVYVGDVSDGNTCPEVITRTWTISDLCGNQITVTQLITVHDTQAPVMAAPPADVTVECVGDIPGNMGLGWTDNCDGSGNVGNVDGPIVGGNCGGTMTRTWSYTDNCGNTASVQQVITINDTQAPVFAAPPANVTVECVGDVPAMTNLAWTDNCDGAGNVAGVDGPIVGGNCGGTITRTWTYTDVCGNVATATQTITINDTQAPVFAAAPADVTVECIGDVPVMTNLGYTDNCDAPGSVAGVDGALTGGPCGGTITRTWTYTDACGNVATAQQVITVDDNTAPVFAAPPANMTVECIGDVPAMTNLGYTDNCDPAGSVAGTDVSDGLSCPETITRTWTFTDACGNVASVSQTITVDDTTPPLGTAPANVTVECVGDVPAQNVADVTGVSDNCTAVPTVNYIGDVSDGLSCPETITRTYEIVDDCGNTTTVTQTITIDDTTPPTATSPAPINLAGGPAPAPDPAVITDEADNCGVPVVALVSNVSDGGNCPETITHTYSVTDACGNQITVQQVYVIGDPNPPTASNPVAVNVECITNVPAPDPLVVTDEADDSGVPVVAFVSDVSDGNSCPEVITRTYSVTDNCGNFIFVTQTITVNDVTPPTGTAPADITVECIGDVPAADPLAITDEADNCGTPTVAHVGDVSDGNTCPEVITRTYSITDSCGNSITVDQIITVDDTQAPVFAAPPANVTVECIGDVPAMTNLGYTDNCDAPGSVAGTDVSDGNTCPEVITRTWTYTDACGNVASVSQTITVDDNTAPVFAAPPANITVECITAVPAMTNLAYTDNCDAPGSVVGTDVSDGNSCPEVITRTWTYTDACGNVATVSQTITVDDTTPPTASNPAQTIVPGGPAPAPDPLVVIDEADNCGVPTVAFVSQVSDGNPCPETITYTYSVTDSCGNSINVTHEVLITDPVAPTGTAPADITVDCITAVPAADPALITDEADNNGLPTVTHLSDVSDGNSCPEVITRTYRITDPCGNFIDVVQLITVHDLTSPTGTAPADITVECIGDVPVADPLLVTDEADNCGTPTVTFTSDVSDGNTCPEIITRTYTITDSCGNTLDVTQQITIDDTTAPLATAPANVNVECITAVPLPNIADVTGVSDNCTAVPVVAHVSDVSDGLSCPETITRTYSITDECGNVTTVTQDIIINDITPPTASNPAQTIVPGGPAPAPDPLVVIDEADNCGVPTVAFVSQVSDGNPCPETITYTYSVTDSCGNSINVTHEVLITDPVAPTGTAPADITVDCITAVPAADPALITDEADNNGLPTVTHLSDVSDGNSCPEVITRTYRITDPCGNFIDVVQLITVHDLTSPTGTAPADITVECIGDVPVADPLLVTDEADNCGTPTVAFVGDVSDNNTCPETITRTYSITDSCGNSITVDQTIIVDDTTAPLATAPANVNIECITDLPAPNIADVTGVSDNCDPNPTVVHVSDVSDGLSCPETITRTYDVTDACGNVTTVTHDIIINDITPPTASNPAQTVIPGGPAPAPDPLVVIDEADNCGVPTVAFVSQVSDGNPCPETITYTYSVTDSCGNSINVTHEVLITDPINPTGTAPADITVDCITAVPAPDPALIVDEADNNGVPTVAHVSDVSDGNSCPEVITRTYSITDICGNQILVTQLITVHDLTLPTGTAPANVTVECIGDVPAADPLLITDEADNCGTPTVTHVGDVSDGNTCPETITRTYAITDSCGNSITVDQIITVDDITAPTGTAPANITVECIGDVPIADPALITDEADNCTVNPTVNFMSDVSDGNTCPETITRTYEIVDDCGNTTLVTQTITVDDITPPTASNLPGQTVVLVTDITPPNVLDVFDEADNCTLNPTVLFVSDVSDGNTCPELVTRTYSVTDDCGNQILVTQIWTVSDVIAPTASNPLPVNVECIGDVPAPDVLVVTDEADNSGIAPTVLFVSDVSDGNTCPEVITRTYSVTDDCGNQILVTQTITVDDITNPTGTAPANVTVECIGDVPAVDPALIVDEADNCTVNPIVTHQGDVSDGLSCPETITRTYRITDDCGNFIDVVQTITVDDITAPTGTAPANLTVECIGDVPAADPALIVDEADNCTVNPVVAFVSDVSDGLSCPETITRTYSITDDCGNVTNVTQTITVDDTTLPTATAPANVTVECIGDVPVADPAVITDEADNCTVNPTVLHVSDVSDGNTCPQVITRTYSVTDDCGNQITLVQTITVNDITLPTASNPANINVACASDVPAPDPAVVTDEVDNCTVAPTVAHVSDVSDGNVCNGEMITRTYSVTDDCGNTINVTQIITIDAQMPVIGAGMDQEVCEGVPVTLIAENPGGVPISWDQGVIDGVAFLPPVGTTTFTVTADVCSGECVATDQVDVTVHPTPIVSFIGDDLYGCVDHTVNFTNTSTDQFNCEWDMGDGTIVNDCGPISHTYTSAGIYDVSLTVTSDQGCVGTDTYNSYVEVVPFPVAAFDYSPYEIDILDTEVQFENNSLYADTYTWSFGDLSAFSFDEHPTHIFPDATGGSYTVTLWAESNAGCADSTTAVITIDEIILFYVPNVFTPDGNSINNTFFPVITAGVDIYDYHMTIFNRWGELIFETYNPGVGWDGTYGGTLVEDGVYIWQIEFGEKMSDKKHKHRGHVTVLK